MLLSGRGLDWDQPLSTAQDQGGDADFWINRDAVFVSRHPAPGPGDTPVPLGPSPGGSFANVLVNNPGIDVTSQNTQSETAITLVPGVDPLGSDTRAIVAYNDSGSNVGGCDKFTGFSLSTDGAASFIDKGTLPNGAHGDAGDPALAYSQKTGTVFLSTLAYSGAATQVFRSTDGGDTFAPAINVHERLRPQRFPR